MFNEIVSYIKEIYPGDKFIPLHEPNFDEREKEFLVSCIDSGYVSSVGKYVDDFEDALAEYHSASKAVVLVNGTEALHLALKVVGVVDGDEVITQPLTFIATANAISYLNAHPLFIDIDKSTLSLSYETLLSFLENETYIEKGVTYNKKTLRPIRACVPMHTFGHLGPIDKIVKLCHDYNIKVVEDGAESLGSKYNNVNAGMFGDIGVVSFNGNKIITTGGGGAIVTNNEEYAFRIKHLSTQAKVPHQWEFDHDEIGFNARMPNVNAALGIAQLSKLEKFIAIKRKLAESYQSFFETINGVSFFKEPSGSVSNYWLNVIVFDEENAKNNFLAFSNSNNVMTRPAWKLMYHLKMFEVYYRDCPNAEWIEKRLVNIPSSVNVTLK